MEGILWVLILPRIVSTQLITRYKFFLTNILKVQEMYPQEETIHDSISSYNVVSASAASFAAVE
jgi:hypothetical protein